MRLFRKCSCQLKNQRGREQLKLQSYHFIISMYGADFRGPGLPKGRFGLSTDSENILYIKTPIFIVNKVICRRRSYFLPFLTCALMQLPAAIELYPSPGFGCPLLPMTIFAKDLQKDFASALSINVAAYSWMMFLHLGTQNPCCLKASSQILGIPFFFWSIALLYRVFSMQKTENSWRLVFP